jgi:MoxR-like ATPase
MTTSTISSTDSAEDAYPTTERTLTKMKNKKVLLRGFDKTSQTLAEETLTRTGYTLASTLTTAEVVVVGPLGFNVETLGPDPKKAVLIWENLRKNLESPTHGEPQDLPRRPVIERSESSVRIVGIDVPLSPAIGGRIPPAERFQRICLDAPFLNAARAVALGATQGLPTTLEGVTAAAKTTVILWVAHLLDQPVARLNLNGQSDVTELIGRYVPAGQGDEDWNLPALARLGHLLKPECLAIIEQAMSEKRSLDWAESSLIQAHTGLTRSRWRFQEGIVPKAMREGGWVLLDEMNLAEPQILERLNPVLECPPSLLLTEGDGTWFGQGGVRVHPGFRVFAAMNPSDYAGRSNLSPAFKDRFLNWFQAQPPGEAEYRSQLRFLIHGHHPEVIIDQTIYQGDPVEPVHGALASVEEIDGLVDGLASCQASLSVGGAGKRDGILFTRRSLNALLDLWTTRIREKGPSAARATLGSSLKDLYWNRIANPADRKAAMGVAEAAGLPVEDAP